MAAGYPSICRRPVDYFYSSGLVGKWFSDHYLKLLNNCVHEFLDAAVRVLLLVDCSDTSRSLTLVNTNPAPTPPCDDLHV